MRWDEKLYFIAFISFSGERNPFATKRKFSWGHANVLQTNLIKKKICKYKQDTCKSKSI